VKRIKQNETIVKCLSVLHGFEWAPDPANNSTLLACVGDDVAIHWTFTTDPHERVESVFWLSENNTHIAYRSYKNFHPTSENFKADYSSVTFTPEASVTLHNVMSSAAGRTGVLERSAAP
jgi:hypothetical protein